MLLKNVLVTSKKQLPNGEKNRISKYLL